MEVMYNRKTGQRYEVYAFDVDHKTALCYDPCIASKSGGNGWQVVQIKLLIPEAYTNRIDGSFMSKTEKSEIKHHLKLVDAIWECTDGTKYTHEALESAINHQRDLLKEEN